MERIGIIDLGSNTARLIVIAYRPGHSFRLVDEVSETVRLAEGVGDDGKLQPAPMRRAIETLRMFHTFCRSTNVGTVVAVSTSAVRESTNRDEFLDTLHQETGLELRILSTEEEAYYGYLGVINSLALNSGFIIDIGGGSTEVAEVYRRTFSRSFSSPVGAVRLTERAVHSDPISKQDFRGVVKGADTAFDELDWFQEFAGTQLVGIGGTIRNLARIDQKRHKHPIGRVHGHVLSLKSLDSIINQLRRSNHNERESISGLNRDRADIILAGATILRQLMRKSGFESLVVGGSGLREGLFYEHFLADHDRPQFASVREFSVLNLARLCDYEEQHVARVRDLSLSLFDQLRPMHHYGAWERELLSYGAILHDIGVVVGYYDHHKHSAYLVDNSMLNGFTHREIALIALLTRYHRKGSVDTRTYQGVLQADDPERVARLSSLLRIAEYLERSKSQVVQQLTVEIQASGDVLVRVQATGDATVEVWDANRRTGLFNDAFGCSIEIV